MATKITVWRGSKKLQHQPDSPEYSETGDGPSFTYTYSGPYAVVMAAKPKRLSSFSGLRAGFVVDKITVKKAKGGVGTLTFTALPVASAGFAGGAEESAPVYEIEWTESQKRLETHPRYSAGGDMELTPRDASDLELWKEEKDPEWRAAFKFAKPGDNPGSYYLLSDHAKDFAGKLLQGVDSWVTFSPICRSTTKHTARPTTGKCGFISVPPSQVRVAGYQYLKTADRVTRDKSGWTRVQEWTGAESIDSDLYK